MPQLLEALEVEFRRGLNCCINTSAFLIWISWSDFLNSFLLNQWFVKCNIFMLCCTFPLNSPDLKLLGFLLVVSNRLILTGLERKIKECIEYQHWRSRKPGQLWDAQKYDLMVSLLEFFHSKHSPIKNLFFLYNRFPNSGKGNLTNSLGTKYNNYNATLTCDCWKSTPCSEGNETLRGVVLSCEDEGHILVLSGKEMLLKQVAAWHIRAKTHKPIIF